MYKAVTIMLAAALACGPASLGLAQGTNRYTTGGGIIPLARRRTPAS